MTLIIGGDFGSNLGESQQSTARGEMEISRGFATSGPEEIAVGQRRGPRAKPFCDVAFAAKCSKEKRSFESSSLLILSPLGPDRMPVPFNPNEMIVVVALQPARCC